MVPQERARDLPAFRRVLVVEDDRSLRRAIVLAFARLGEEDVVEAGTAAEARDHLLRSPAPDLVIVDVRLPDDSIFATLKDALARSPTPVVIAISGKASPHDAFRLAQLGVRAYLPKPFSIEDLARAVAEATRSTPDLEPFLHATVGHVPMRDVLGAVRRSMVEEALARAEGNRSGAARLLKVTRQAVQQMIRSARAEEPGPGESAKAER